MIILLTEIGQSLIPVERYAQSSVLVDKKIFFFGGETYHISLKSFSLNQILYHSVIFGIPGSGTYSHCKTVSL